MLLGTNIHVFTDNKNLTFDILKTLRILPWRNKAEEYLYMLHYIEIPKNILADKLSRLQRLIYLDQLDEGKKLIEPIAFSDDEDSDDAYLLDLDFSGLIDNDINDALNFSINIPDSDTPEQNTLKCDYILEQKQDDEKLLDLQVKYTNNYIYKSLDDDVEDILCYVTDHDDTNTQCRIALPKSMLEETVKWFHIFMGHPGENPLI